MSEEKEIGYDAPLFDGNDDSFRVPSRDVYGGPITHFDSFEDMNDHVNKGMEQLMRLEDCIAYGGGKVFFPKYHGPLAMIENLETGGKVWQWEPLDSGAIEVEGTWVQALVYNQMDRRWWGIRGRIRRWWWRKVKKR